MVTEGHTLQQLAAVQTPLLSPRKWMLALYFKKPSNFFDVKKLNFWEN